VEIPAVSGSYIVIGRLDNDVILNSGPFSERQVTQGYYLYSGSAYGPGGLCARITRHLNPDSKKFWHFDHLKANLFFEEILYSVYALNHECELIKAIQEMEKVSFPLPGFGSSDCRKGCPAHLAMFPLYTNIESVINNLESGGLSLERLSFK
jgi:Uri superfamily endonuclease